MHKRQPVDEVYARAPVPGGRLDTRARRLRLRRISVANSRRWIVPKSLPRPRRVRDKRLTIAAAAVYLGISHRKVEELIPSGRLVGQKLNLHHHRRWVSTSNNSTVLREQPS